MSASISLPLNCFNWFFFLFSTQTLLNNGLEIYFIILFLKRNFTYFVMPVQVWGPKFYIKYCEPAKTTSLKVAETTMWTCRNNKFFHLTVRDEFLDISCKWLILVMEMNLFFCWAFLISVPFFLPVFFFVAVHVLISTWFFFFFPPFSRPIWGKVLMNALFFWKWNIKFLLVFKPWSIGFGKCWSALQKVLTFCVGWICECGTSCDMKTLGFNNDLSFCLELWSPKI